MLLGRKTAQYFGSETKVETRLIRMFNYSRSIFPIVPFFLLPAFLSAIHSIVQLPIYTFPVIIRTHSRTPSLISSHQPSQIPRHTTPHRITIASPSRLTDPRAASPQP
jgi:hypothetical protein